MLRCLAMVVLVSACGSSPRQSGGDAPISHDAHVDTAPPVDAFAGPFGDFPASPILDGIGDVSGLFTGTGATTGGPCLVEPELGTLFPRNWLRPRFTWVPTGSENLFELTLQTANETNILTVYTQASTWTMPDDIWTALSQHIIDQGIFVRVRGATYDGTTLTSGPELGASGSIAIAPADAPGAIVYWTTSNGTKLRGFHIGDETVTDIVTTADTHSQCIGCHTSTPDGMYVGLSSTQDSGNGDPAAMVLLSSDGTLQTPSYITPSAQTLMARTYQEEPSFTAQHYSTGDRIALSEYPPNADSHYEITWTDLEATSTAEGAGWGTIPRTGETTPTASASWAHTTDTILYVKASSSVSGVTVHDGDIETVPYAGGGGGVPTPIAGAATTSFNEYYPTFSPDDKFIAFNRVPNGDNSYNNADAEVFVISAQGGDAQRLEANDPVQCGAAPRMSPGVTNSWPKWAPAVTDTGTKRYYWLTFSSTRLSPATGDQHPQLFVSPVVDDGSGTLQFFPALYLWNQPTDENNHTPAWDNFTIVTGRTQ